MTGLSPQNHEMRIITLRLDACLREAASAKAGGRIKVGVDMAGFPLTLALLNQGDA